MKKGQLKGYAFEYFVKNLLMGCGFSQVTADGLIVYDGGAGRMIQGLGEAHNADVLMSPPIQTPFYFPTCLLVECKCHSDKLGLREVRNILGLREDINNFEIVTEDMLRMRKNPRHSYLSRHTIERKLYQVALASTSGFKDTAISYANTHRIPLISFAESRFLESIRASIALFDSIEDEELQKQLKDIFKMCKEYRQKLEEFKNSEALDSIKIFFKEVDRLSKNWWCAEK